MTGMRLPWMGPNGTVTSGQSTLSRTSNSECAWFGVIPVIVLHAFWSTPVWSWTNMYSPSTEMFSTIFFGFFEAGRHTAPLDPLTRKQNALEVAGSSASTISTPRVASDTPAPRKALSLPSSAGVPCAVVPGSPHPLRVLARRPESGTTTCSGRPQLATERAGFEPAMEFNPHTRLAGECLQPLGHL